MHQAHRFLAPSPPGLRPSSSSIRHPFRLTSAAVTRARTARRELAVDGEEHEAEIQGVPTLLARNITYAKSNRSLNAR